MTSLYKHLQWLIANCLSLHNIANIVVSLIALELAQRNSNLASGLNCSDNSKHQPASSTPFLWVVQQSSRYRSYLFGTAHVPYPRVWQALTSHHVTAAFQSADRVYFEVDMADWQTVHYISYCQLLPESYTVADVIPRDLLNRVRQYLKHVRKSLPQWLANSRQGETTLSADAIFRSLTHNWARKRPAWLLLTLTSLTEGEVAWYGQHVVDLFLSKAARLLRKRVGAVENVRQQCDVINALNTSQVVTAIDLLLKRREYQMKATNGGNANNDVKTRDHLANVVDSYLCGDIGSVVSEYSGSLHTTGATADGLSSDEVTLLAAVDSHFKDALLLSRNGAMAKEMERLMHRRVNESLFFAVGAAHFVGRNSIIERLQQRGFIIEKSISVTSLFDDRQTDYQRKVDFEKLARRARHESDERLWTDLMSFVSATSSHLVTKSEHESHSNSNQSRQDVNIFSRRHQSFKPVVVTSRYNMLTSYQTLATSSAHASSAVVWHRALISSFTFMFHFEKLLHLLKVECNVCL